ncbi:MAG: hypothetical protein EBQ78_04310 [Betaproteobacteria bacterium]|nr:hypothetical protein [Betaproteobacteria bacterium]
MNRFVAGTTTADVVATVQNLHNLGLLATVDRLGEDTLDRAAADTTVADYKDVLRALSAAGLSDSAEVLSSYLQLVKRSVTAARVLLLRMPWKFVQSQNKLAPLLLSIWKITPRLIQPCASCRKLEKNFQLPVVFSRHSYIELKMMWPHTLTTIPVSAYAKAPMQKQPMLRS